MFIFLFGIYFSCTSICIAHGWAEETLAHMTLQQKVGQLFMVRPTYLPPQLSINLLEEDAPVAMNTYLGRLIKNYHIGGIILFNGTIESSVSLINQAQQLSQLPLLVGIDAEWGLGMRLNDGISFPKQMTLGALQGNSLIVNMGAEIGRQCRAMGIHINFAPVVDINTNPSNPIIGMRAFGDDKEVIADKGSAFMQGLQMSGMLTCAKHFPGHGDTMVDSHLGLPILGHDRECIFHRELSPFIKLIGDGIDAMMVAHLAIPALECPDKSVVLSRTIVTDLLRDRLGFKGLIVTDGMRMKGIANFYKPEEAALQAIIAGNDILIDVAEVERCIHYIIQAVHSGLLDRGELDQHVLRILRAKEMFVLHNCRMVQQDDIVEKINTQKANALKKTIYEKSVTVLNNDEGVFPLRDMKKMLLVDIGPSIRQPEDSLILPLDADQQDVSRIIESLQPFHNTVVVRLFKLDQNQGKYGTITELAPVVEYFFKELKKTGKYVVLILATTPYALPLLPDYPTIVVYENDPDAISVGMDVLAGNLRAVGRLPIRF